MLPLMFKLQLFLLVKTDLLVLTDWHD